MSWLPYLDKTGHCMCAFPFFREYFRAPKRKGLNCLNSLNISKPFVNWTRMCRNMSTFYLPTFKNELSRLKIFLVFVFITITSASFAQSIFENAITGTDPSNNNPYSAGQTIVNGITSTGIGYGTGLNNSNASDRYNTNGFSTNGTLNAANNDFISWTITPPKTTLRYRWHS